MEVISVCGKVVLMHKSSEIFDNFNFVLKAIMSFTHEVGWALKKYF
jgi:hypothetical protein